MPPIWREIQHICSVCQGSGNVIPPHDNGSPIPDKIECPICKGEGYLEWGREKV